MRPHVLMTYALPDKLQDELSSRYELLGPMTEVSVAGLPKTDLSQVRALLTRGGLPVDSALMDALPSLELIHCYGTGYDLIDLEAASARNIQVTNAGAANASAVAEYTLALMLSGLRGVVSNDAFVRSGQWHGSVHGKISLAPSLVGQKLGIYGLGAIGQRVASRAQAMEMKVGYHGRSVHTDSSLPFFPTLKELAEWADVLVVSARAGDYNYHVIDSEILGALGHKGYLINISRGYVVDEEALISALSENGLGGAALDVFEHEPHIPEALMTDPRVLLSPHVAPHTEQAQSAMRDEAVHNIDALFSGKEELRNIIN